MLVDNKNAVFWVEIRTQHLFQSYEMLWDCCASKETSQELY